MPAAVVIKLGGSYAHAALAPERTQWLDAIDRWAGEAVVVAGGGPFADAVRAAQREMGFDDRAAHHMALLAMEQHGRALLSFRPHWKLAGNVEAIRAAMAAGGVPVWAPVAMALAAKDLPESWEFTSDSLAAWLAGILGAGRLLLIKPIARPRADVSAAELAARGVVDPVFPEFLGASGAQAYIAGPADHAIAAAGTGRSGLPGSRIVLP